jgi:hypothetical protein
VEQWYRSLLPLQQRVLFLEVDNCSGNFHGSIFVHFWAEKILRDEVDIVIIHSMTPGHTWMECDRTAALLRREHADADIFCRDDLYQLAKKVAEKEDHQGGGRTGAAILMTEPLFLDYGSASGPRCATPTSMSDRSSADGSLRCAEYFGQLFRTVKTIAKARMIVVSKQTISKGEVWLRRSSFPVQHQP